MSANKYRNTYSCPSEFALIESGENLRIGNVPYSTGVGRDDDNDDVESNSRCCDGRSV
jgi:hypothetical protein